MHITGPRDGPTVKVGCAVTDLTTGMYATTSVLASLIERSSLNLGQHLDICLSDCQVATLSNMAQSVLVTDQRDSGRWGNAHREYTSLLLPSTYTLNLSSICGPVSII
jgi:succinate--hydroxymethylglutarate CoA-transferase